MNKRTETLIIVFIITGVAIVSAVMFGSITTIPFLTNSVQNFQPFKTLTLTATPLTGVTCSLTNNGHIQGTHGTDTATNSVTNLFHPLFYASLLNDQNGDILSQVKFIVYLYCQSFPSNLASVGYHPYLTGGTISMQFEAKDTAGNLRSLGSPQTVSVSPAQVDVGTNSIPIATFTIPALVIQNAVGQKSTDYDSLNYAVTTGTLYFKQKLDPSQVNAVYTIPSLTTNYWITVKGTGQTTTNTPTSSNTNNVQLGCSGSVCSTIPIVSAINYNLAYDDGSVQSGTSPNNVVVPTTFDLFKQDADKTPNLTDITFIVIAKTTDPYSSTTISNPNLNIGGHIQVGGEQPFNIPSSDFTVTPINSITDGIARINLPINTLQNEIKNHLSQVYTNPQQTTVTLSVDGTFNLLYQGKSGSGKISGLTWSFPIMYGNSAYTKPVVYCNTDQTSGINPNGLSPSSSVSDCIPPPTNTKQCSDGTIVPVNAICTTLQTVPNNMQQCSDGSIIPITSTCPVQQHPSTTTQQCADGSVIPITSTCLVKNTSLQQCSDGSVIPKTSTCPSNPSLFKSTTNIPSTNDVLNWIIANPVMASGIIIIGFLIFIMVLVIVTRRR